MLLGKREPINSNHLEIEINTEDIIRTNTNPKQPKIFEIYGKTNQEEIQKAIREHGIHPAGNHLLDSLATLFERCDHVIADLVQGTKKVLNQEDFYKHLIRHGMSANLPFIFSYLCPSTYLMSMEEDACYDMDIHELAKKISITPMSGWQGPPFKRTLSTAARTYTFFTNMKKRLQQLDTSNMNWSRAMLAYKNYLASMLRPELRSSKQLLNKLCWLSQLNSENEDNVS